MLTLLLAGSLLGGCGGATRHPTTGATSPTGVVTGSGRGAWANLRIAYRAHRLTAGESQVWTLSCRPTGGDHPRAAQACAELAAHHDLLTGPSRGRVECGVVLANGPSVLVTGTIAARAVHYSPVSICDPGWSELRLLLTGTLASSSAGAAGAAVNGSRSTG